MIKDTVIKVKESLNEEKNKIVSFLNERMRSIVFPEDVAIGRSEKVENNDKTPLLIAGGGALGLLIGICSGAKWLSAIGLCAGAIGGVMYFKNKKGTVHYDDQQQTNEIDYSKLSNSIYKTMESAHSHITKEWDNYLGQQNSMLKSEIRSTVVDDDKKNELLDKVTRRSQIHFSMMDANSDLLSSSRSKDVNAIKSVMLSLIEKYKVAIEQAYKEQLSFYSSLLE